MDGDKMKTKLTTSERIKTLAGITTVCVLISSLIGKKLFSQAVLTAVFYLLVTGKRPGIVFATVHKLKRDVL